jgi:twinkle protein
MPWASVMPEFNFEYGTTTIIAGYNGHGKTTVIGHIVVDAIKQGVKQCVASLEFKPDKWIAAIVRQTVAEQMPNESRVMDGMNFLAPSLWAFDVGGKGMGTARVDKILEVFAYARARYGVRCFIIDNFTKLGLAEDDYTGQKEAIVKITEFGVEHDVVMIVAAHLKKAEGGDREVGGKHGVRGAGAITDLVDNVWICHRNRRKEARLKEIEYGLRSGTITQDDSAKLREEKDALLNQGDTMMYCEKYRNGDSEPRLRLFFDRNSHQFRDDRDHGTRRYA